MKILMINQTLCNRGDESAHKALLREILERIPSAYIRVLFVSTQSPYSINQFAIDDKRVEYVNIHPFMRYSKISEVALRKPYRKLFWRIHPTMRQILSHYKWSDLVLCAPGGICMGGFQDWKHLYFLKLAKFCHKPIAYYGRSIGPFPTETNLNVKFKEISSEMLNYFSYLSLRDKKSENIAKEMGIQYVSTIDSAFLETPSVLLPYEVNMMLNGKQYMVFVPNYLLWHYKYKGHFTLEELIEFYSKMVRVIWDFNPKLSIVMLPQTFDQGEMRDDVNLFRLIAENLNDQRVVVFPDCYSSDIQQTIISKAAFVIGARYHSIVFAINQSTPFIALSYEHKMTGLLETLGCTENLLDFQDTMFAEHSKEECLKKIGMILPKLKLNSDVQKLAKNIARQGMDKFIDKFYKI